jgi:hypothetical protein
MQHVNPDKLLYNFCDQRLFFEFKMKTKGIKSPRKDDLLFSNNQQNWKVLLIVDWHYINTHNILPVKNSDNAVINDLVRVITAGRKDAQHFHIKKNESCSAWDNKYCVRAKRSPHHQMLIQLESGEKIFIPVSHSGENKKL